MGKYTMNTLLGDALKDERITEILSKNFPTAVNHPRFIEAGDYTFKQIIDMDFGAVVGIPKVHVKKVIKSLLDLE